MPLAPAPRHAGRRALPALAALLLAVPALAQPAPSAGAPVSLAPPAALDVRARREVIDTLADRLARIYVSADTARLIADHLRRRLAAGAYDAAADPFRFAELLTDDLHAVNGDLHLQVSVDPRAADFAPDIRGGIRMPQRSPVRSADPPELVTAERRRHYGLGRVDVLPGNIGYIELRGFGGGSEADSAAVDALRYLAHTSAIIFDLRQNRGGSGLMSNFLVSHFVGADSAHTLRIVNRSSGQVVDRWTLAHVPGPRRPDVPLYVLTSRSTVSAGEDFAFVLQNLHRATIVGDRTAGAGHNNVDLPIGHGFAASISFTRVTDPATGREWERIGVRPDIAVPTERALAAAQRDILEHLAAAAGSEAERQRLSLAAETVRALEHPVAVDSAALAPFLGRYGRDRGIGLEGGRVMYQPRPGMVREALVPVAPLVFATGDGIGRIRLERDAAGAPELRVISPDGGDLTYPRTGSDPALWPDQP